MLPLAIAGPDYKNYNVRSFGAVGNGIADDTAEIQAAIDAAYAAGGGIVYIPAGTYLLSASLVLRNGVSIFGVFPGATPSYADWWSLSSVVSRGTVLTFPGGTVFTNDVTQGDGSASGVDGCIIEGLGFDDVGSIITVGDTNKDGLNGCVVRDLLFSNVTGVAFDLTNTNLCNFSNLKGFLVHQFIRFTCDEDTTVVSNNCGNSFFSDLYADIAGSGNPYPSIHLRAIDRNGNGSHLGSLHFAHTQVNRMKSPSNKDGNHLFLEGTSGTSIVGSTFDYCDFEGNADARIALSYAVGTRIVFQSGANGTPTQANSDIYARNSTNTRIESQDPSLVVDIDASCFPTSLGGFISGVTGGGVEPQGVYVMGGRPHIGPLPTADPATVVGDLWSDGGIVTLGSGAPSYETPSYDNVGGKGDRTASITVTSNISSDGSPVNWQELVDGLKADPANMYWHNIDVSGKYIRFQFVDLKLMTELTYWGDPSYDGAWGTALWKIQGSNDGSNWDDLCTATLGTHGVGGQYTFDMSGNSTPYSYYQYIGASGTLGGYSVPQEFEFKIGNQL